MQAHNTSGDAENLKIKFDAMASHDITFVGIIQTCLLYTSRANKKAMHAQLEQQARELLAQMGLSERADHYPQMCIRDRGRQAL